MLNAFWAYLLTFWAISREERGEPAVVRLGQVDIGRGIGRVDRDRLLEILDSFFDIGWTHFQI